MTTSYGFTGPCFSLNKPPSRKSTSVEVGKCELTIKLQLETFVRIYDQKTDVLLT